MKAVALKLSVKGGLDPIPWSGYVVAPGLAVCKMPAWESDKWVPAYRRWQVIHVQSGFGVHSDAMELHSRSQAVVVVERLVGLTDWTQPIDELVAVQGLKEEVGRVIGGNNEGV